LAKITHVTFIFISVRESLRLFQALLVFQRLPVCRQKPNVLFVRLALFPHETQRKAMISGSFQANDFGPLIITRVIGRFILIFISSKINNK